MTPAWSNAVAAMPNGPFVQAIGKAVANDGSADGGAAWLLSFGSDFLRKHGRAADSPWAAFDMFVVDYEALDQIWPGFEFAASLQPIPAAHILPALARFMADRMPVVWEGDHGAPFEPCDTPRDPRPAKLTEEERIWNKVPPVTLCLALADKIDMLVGMFAAGGKPNGSKDPYALRRAAKEVLQMVLFPVRRLA